MNLRVLHGIQALVVALLLGGVATVAAASAPPQSAPGALETAPAAEDPLLLNEPLLVDPAPPEPPPARPLRALEPAPAPGPDAASAPGSDAVLNPYATIVWDESPDAAHAVPAGALVQVGEASWYGDYFHGRTTASGEIYDMHASTVAHPTWPLGAVVRIRNLGNGRTTLARVNDRGPYARGRILDCSYAVAGMLGFIGTGTTDVEITLLDAGTDAWKRFDPALAPKQPFKKFGPPAPVEFAAALATVEDTSPPLPVLVLAEKQTGAALANRAPLFRTASVVPFPAIVHAWQGLSRWLAGTAESPGEWPRFERRLERIGWRRLVTSALTWQ